MSQVTARIVPEASSNPLKLPKFPRDTSIEFMDVGTKGPTMNVVGATGMRDLRSRGVSTIGSSRDLEDSQWASNTACRHRE